MSNSNKLKRGKASTKEEEYIRDSHEVVSVKDMAKKLNRSEAFVTKRISQIPVMQEIDDNDDAISRLHKSDMWLPIQRTLLSSEISLFEQRWAKLIDQFSTNEILATDEMMIKDLIMLEIGGLRANSEKKKSLVLLAELDKKIESERKLDEDMQDVGSLAMWQSQLNALRAALPSLSKEFLEYQHRKDQKLRDLKATRDLRFKHMEESKKNIFELIKDLDSHAKRKQEGRWAELMLKSSQKIEDEWQQQVKFEDGQYNTPFLSPEGILKDDEVIIKDQIEED